MDDELIIDNNGKIRIMIEKNVLYTASFCITKQCGKYYIRNFSTFSVINRLNGTIIFSNQIGNIEK